MNGEDASHPEEEADRLREQMAATVDACCDLAGGQAPLANQIDGISEGTIRNWRSGKFPQKQDSSKAHLLDAWAERHAGDLPTLSGQSLESMLRRWQHLQSLSRAKQRAFSPEPTGPGTGSGVALRRLLHRRPTSRAHVAVAVAVVLTIIGVVVLEQGQHDGEVASTAAASTGVRAVRHLDLTKSNFCSWRLGSAPIPLVARDPLIMRVDARCNDPRQVDPAKDPGATVYARPDNRTKPRGQIRDGNTFVPVCFVADGRTVRDAAGNASSIWVRTQDPVGLIPDVNIGGGYTVRQLKRMGVGSC